MTDPDDAPLLLDIDEAPDAIWLLPIPLPTLIEHFKPRHLFPIARNITDEYTLITEEALAIYQQRLVVTADCDLVVTVTLLPTEGGGETLYKIWVNVYQAEDTPEVDVDDAILQILNRVPKGLKKGADKLGCGMPIPMDWGDYD